MAAVTIDWCSESLTEVLVMPVMLSTGDARGTVLLVADIGCAKVLVSNGVWGPLLAAETSLFSVSETEFGRVSCFCNYIEWCHFSEELNIY